MIFHYDGNVVADRFARHSATKSLADKLRRIRDIASIREDLFRAAANLEELFSTVGDDFDGKQYDISKKESVLHGALAQHAIIVYARATDTASDIRGKFDVSRHLNAEQQRHHRAILKARNAAIAHYGSGTSDGRAWNEDNIFISNNLISGELTIEPMPRQYNFRGDVLGALYRLLPIVIDGSKKDLDQLYSKFFKEMIEKKQEVIKILGSVDVLPNIPRAVGGWMPPPNDHEGSGISDHSIKTA